MKKKKALATVRGPRGNPKGLVQPWNQGETGKGSAVKYMYMREVPVTGYIPSRRAPMDGRRSAGFDGEKRPQVGFVTGGRMWELRRE